MSRNSWIAVVISIGVVGFFLFGGTVVNMFMLGNQGQSTAVDLESQTNAMNTPNTEGLVMQDQVVGTGDEAMNGDLVTVNYVGMFENGQKFDASADHGQPFQFVVGRVGPGGVIQGWNLGVLGMKVGGKRILTVPASLAYGNQTVGPIPANSTLLFEIELLKVEKAQ